MDQTGGLPARGGATPRRGPPGRPAVDEYAARPDSVGIVDQLITPRQGAPYQAQTQHFCYGPPISRNQ
jgi:hypothetical protein